MPARISRPVIKRILRLHEQGMRFKDIAAREGLSPATVAKHCKRADAEAEVLAAPAAEFDADDVLRLRAIAPQVISTCCPDCGEPMLVLRTMANGLCPHCGSGWSRQIKSPDDGAGAANHPLSGRPPVHPTARRPGRHRRR